MQDAAPSTFHCLNGMRGIAALAVVLFHTELLTGIAVVPGGYLAVDLFFIMSGCVIAHAYEKRLAGGMTLQEFAARRLIRFLPFYLCGLACGVVLVALQMIAGGASAPPVADFVMVLIFSLLFLPAVYLPAAGALFPFNLPAWTLFYELVVNMLFALFRPFLSDQVLALVAAVALCVTVWGVYVHGNLSFGFNLASAPEAFARTVFSFVLGILIYRHQCNWRLSPMLVVVLAMAVFLVPVSAAWRSAFDLTVVVLVFPIITIVLLATPANGLTKLFTVLGDMSYGIYAIHYPLIGLTGWLARGTDYNLVALTVGLVIAIIIFSVFAERRLDKPFRAWLVRSLPAFLER